jgi:hypothetical protein
MIGIGSTQQEARNKPSTASENGMHARTSCFNGNLLAVSNNGKYATNEDFCKLFTKDVKGLYLLSFLLTANYEKAERCFVAGLDGCVNGNSVFREWAHSWARRVIIRQAVRMVAPHANPAGRVPGALRTEDGRGLRGIALHDARLARVLALEDIERFAYVLAVLEGYPDQNCAVLLGISRQEVRETRIRAIERIANFDTKHCTAKAPLAATRN